MKVIIIGGGAAGMMAAISASKSKNNQVVLYEKNAKLGKKIFITGKGRCNLTNDCDILDFYKNIVTNQKFMYSSLSIFNNKNMMELLESNGLKLKTERGNRVFPASDKAYDVTETLKNIIKDNGAIIKLKHELVDVEIEKEESLKISEERGNKEKYTGKVKSVKLKDLSSGKILDLTCDKLIIATGGLTYPSTGSTGDGYKIAKKLGIAVEDLEPSLVAFQLDNAGINEVKVLDKLELKNVGIKIYNDINPKKILYEDFGDMLFIDEGIEGPIIISASSYITEKMIGNEGLILSIDLKSALDYDTLDKRIIREIDNLKLESKNANNNINNKYSGNHILQIIKTLLPTTLAELFLARLACIDGFNINKNINEITKEDRAQIIKLLKDYRYKIIGKKSFDRAIITKGGINCNELNPKNMESKKIKGLHFAGEIIDVDCLTGGFNLQVAFTTGFAAGRSEN